MATKKTKNTVTAPAKPEVPEWYRHYRPQELAGVIGQDKVTSALATMLAQGTLPHALLFAGNSGTGKTTVARILKDHLGCSDMDFYEINAADARGIDTVRDIQQRMHLSPMGGRTRIYLLDEAHKLTGDAQTALLKMTEDPPKHVYFIFCTTHVAKLIPTLKTRLTTFQFADCTPDAITTVLCSILESEGRVDEADEALLDNIAEASQGSVRHAIVELQRVMSLPPDERIEAVTQYTESPKAFGIAQKLAKGTRWKDICHDVGEITAEEVETARHVIMGYGKSILVKGGVHGKAVAMIENFQFPFYDSGLPGFVLACLKTCN